MSIRNICAKARKLIGIAKLARSAMRIPAEPEPQRPTREKTVCLECGSEDVQLAMWVQVNTDEVHDMLNSDYDCARMMGNSWCAECETHTMLGDVEVPS